MNHLLKEKQMSENDRLVSSWDPLPQDENEYQAARNGDHLMAPFGYDFYIFSKLKEREPIPTDNQDELLLALIRRANLDVFWSSAAGTVDDNTKRLSRALRFSHTMGLKGPYRQEGPYPPGDYCGYEAAYQILLNSLNKGRINPKYTQWNTIRHLRAAYGNQIRSSSQGNQLLLSTDDSFGTYKRIGKDPCGSLWFHKFTRGCHNRMGDEQRTNKALSIPLLKKLLRQVETNI